METKVCCTCKVEKELSEFNKNKSTKDGYQLNCNECHKKSNDKYRLKNTEMVKEVDTKVCSSCKIEKDAAEFNKRNGSKDGLGTICKDCVKEYGKKYYQENKEKYVEYGKNRDRDKKRESDKKYYEANKDSIDEYKREWYLDNRESILEKRKGSEEVKEYMVTYRKENKDKISITTHEYWVKNRDSLILKGRKYKLDNVDYLKEYDRQFKEKYPEKIKKWSREYYLKNSMFGPYAHQLTIEEDPIEGENGELLVMCSHCNKYFNPINMDVANRVNSLKGICSGEHRLYCSDKCKIDCDIYGAIKIPKSLRNVKKQSRCHQNINRKALLDLQIDECGYNYCEKCGKEFDASDLALHHNIMVSNDHTMADDMSHQLLCCVEHHEHKGC